MNRLASAIAWVLVLSWANSVHALPLLSSGVSLGMDVGDLADPTFVDWNADGKKDILIGQQSGGKIRVYHNDGTDAAPSFNSFYYLKAKGGDLTTPYC